MINSRYYVPGTPPGHLVADPALKRPPRITLVEYNRNELVEREITSIDEILACRADDKISWVNIDGLGDVEFLQALAVRMGFHALSIEDVVHVPQRPKLEVFEDHLFAISQMVYVNAEHDVSFEQISMFLQLNLLVTIQEEAGRDVFDPVRHRLRHGKGFARRMTHDYLAYALLDAIVDHYFPVLESLGDAIEELEEELLERPTQHAMLRIQKMKRTLLQLRRYAWATREVISGLSRDESGLVHAETRVFLRDCYDHTIQIIDVTETYREITTGLMDLYMSTIGLRTSEIMRVLTVISAIFIPLTFVAGVYGMNFDTEASRWNMPELLHPYGYVICIAIMASMALGMLLFFRHKRWI